MTSVSANTNFADETRQDKSNKKLPVQQADYKLN